MMIRLLLIALLASPAYAYDPFALDETRYCGPPRRNAAGQILRSSAARDAFQRLHPCPATGKTAGPCPGWQVDHIIPLASCGCDSVTNMQWLPVSLKTCAGVACKDRWERRIYTCP
jgi:hypothetical protein